MELIGKRGIVICVSSVLCTSLSMTTPIALANIGSKVAVASVNKHTDRRLVDDTAKLNKYMYENFGGDGDPQFKVPWFNYIKKITLTGNNRHYVITVSTTLSNGESGYSNANHIMSSIFGWGNDINNPVQIAWIIVLDRSAKVLLQKDNPINK